MTVWNKRIFNAFICPLEKSGERSRKYAQHLRFGAFLERLVHCSEAQFGGRQHFPPRQRHEKPGEFFRLLKAAISVGAGEHKRMLAVKNSRN